MRILGQRHQNRTGPTLKPFENSSDGGRKRYIPWATQQRRKTDDLKYLRGHKIGKAHDHDTGAGLERGKKRYPASMQTPDLEFSRKTKRPQESEQEQWSEKIGKSKDWVVWCRSRKKDEQ